MPICNRNIRRNFRVARETVAEELYNAPDNRVITRRCCDSCCGYREIDARRHNSYWPSFAHPRWLTCSELNNRRIYSRCPRSGLL